jgi:hypothetical protein
MEELIKKIEEGIENFQIKSEEDISYLRERFIYSSSEGKAFNEVLLLCAFCHTKLEENKELTKQWFAKLRR